jgi:protein O-mannosyl-transferase
MKRTIRQTTPRAPRGAAARAAILFIVAVLAVTAVVYAPVGSYGFVSIDDAVYTTENPYLRDGVAWSSLPAVFTTVYANFWHPLTLVSLMLDVALFGLRPGPLHVVNLLLHLGSTVFLYLALLRMTGAAGRSAFVAALFALHPLHVESVAWIAERKDVLSTCLWMLTLWTWSVYAVGKRRWAYWAALAWFGLGLMAKPMLVTLPVTLLLLDAWPLGRVSPERPRGAGRWREAVRGWGPLVREKIPFFALAALAGAAAVAAQGGAVATLEAVPLSPRVANALVAAATYVVKTMWPGGLTVFYPMPAAVPIASAVASAAALGTITTVVVFWRRRWPWLAVGWFWYLVTLLPVSGIVQVGTHAMADRYTYIPLIGLFVMASWGAAGLVGAGRSRERWLGAVAACAVAACAVTARAQVATWNDSATLWRHALEVSRENYYAHHAVGDLLRQQGRLEEAIGEFAESIRLNPRFPDAHNNLGMALEALGRVDEALAQYQAALQIDPGYPAAHNNVGAVLLRLGRAGEAAAHFAEALRRWPDFAIARENLGQALAAQGRFADAEAEYAQALRLRPDFAAAHGHMGMALASQGRLAEAVEQYRSALRLDPAGAETHNNLGTALGSLGRADEAIAEFEEAVRLDPRSAVARVNLGFTLAGQGRAPEAIPHFQEAVRLQPDLEPAHLYLGWALAGTGRPDEAIAQFKEVLRLDPTSEPARRALDTLTRRSSTPRR